jgi:hypothetical protein
MMKKTKYIFVSRDQNVGSSRSTRTDNNYFKQGGRIQILGNELNKSNSI